MAFPDILSDSFIWKTGIKEGGEALAKRNAHQEMTRDKLFSVPVCQQSKQLLFLKKKSKFPLEKKEWVESGCSNILPPFIFPWHLTLSNGFPPCAIANAYLLMFQILLGKTAGDAGCIPFPYDYKFLDLSSFCSLLSRCHPKGLNCPTFFIHFATLWWCAVLLGLFFQSSLNMVDHS